MIGKIVVLVGLSGSGKSFLQSEILKQRKDFTTSVSMTTRPPRDGEVHGEDYYFVSDREFMDLYAREYFANVDLGSMCGGKIKYGTPRSELEKTGKSILMVLSPQGAKDMLELFGDERVLVINVVASSDTERVIKMIERPHMSRKDIVNRLRVEEAVLGQIANVNDWTIFNDYSDGFIPIALKQLDRMLKRKFGDV